MRNSVLSVSQGFDALLIPLITLVITCFVWVFLRSEKLKNNFFHARAALPHIQQTLSKYWLIKWMDGCDLRKISPWRNAWGWKREDRLQRTVCWWSGKKQRKRTQTNLYKEPWLGRIGGRQINSLVRIWGQERNFFRGEGLAELYLETKEQSETERERRQKYKGEGVP